MKSNENQLNKTHIIIAIIIGTSILGFGILNYVSGEQNRALEKMKLQQTEKQTTQQQIQAKQEQDANKQALNACLTTAETNYSNNWFTECKSEGKLTDACISLHDMTYDEYAKQNNIPKDKMFDGIANFTKAQNDCSCRLPQYNADSISKTLQDDKAVCFKEYPQNQ